MINLDQLLYIISIIGWVLAAIVAIVVFVNSFLHEGIVIALMRLLSARVLIPVAIAIGLSLLSAAVVFILPNQVGVAISVISPAGVQPQPLRAGLHLIVPVLENEVTYPIHWQTYTMSGKPNEGQRTGDDSIRARTSDGQEVRLDSSVIFRLNPDRIVTLHVDWQTRYIEDFVRPVIRGVVRTQVSQFKVKEVNSSSRADLEITLERLLREEFASKGLILDQFLLRDIAFTDQYANAVEEKQVALEDQERTAHQAQQMRNLAEGTRDQLKTEAEGRAAAILTEADAQSKALKLIADSLAQNPDLLTYEYIQKLSPNIRAMLVPNNSPLILPLPQLDEIAPPPTSTVNLATSITVDATSPVTEAVAATATPTGSSLRNRP